MVTSNSVNPYLLYKFVSWYISEKVMTNFVIYVNIKKVIDFQSPRG